MIRGSVTGTPSYMPAEIAAGKSADAGPKVDIDLLGAMLYELFTGSVPRRGSSRDEILELARMAEPVRPRSINLRIARPLEAICMKAMKKYEADRYELAMLLAEDVRGYLAGEPVTVYPEPLPARIWQWDRRHRRSLARAAVALLVLLITLASFIAIRESRKRMAAA